MGGVDGAAGCRKEGAAADSARRDGSGLGEAGMVGAGLGVLCEGGYSGHGQGRGARVPARGSQRLEGEDCVALGGGEPA